MIWIIENNKKTYLCTTDAIETNTHIVCMCIVEGAYITAAVIWFVLRDAILQAHTSPLVANVWNYAATATQKGRFQSEDERLGRINHCKNIHSLDVGVDRNRKIREDKFNFWWVVIGLRHIRQHQTSKLGNWPTALCIEQMSHLLSIRRHKIKPHFHDQNRCWTAVHQTVESAFNDEIQKQNDSNELSLWLCILLRVRIICKAMSKMM